MDIEFDPAKNGRNIELSGLPFEMARQFDHSNAWVVVDERREYGEIRYRALGYLNLRLHVLVFTETLGGIRVSRFRKANTREEKGHALEKGRP
jgi:hypothetical protein